MSDKTYCPRCRRQNAGRGAVCVADWLHVASGGDGIDHGFTDLKLRECEHAELLLLRADLAALRAAVLALRSLAGDWRNAMPANAGHVDARETRELAAIRQCGLELDSTLEAIKCNQL